MGDPPKTWKTYTLSLNTSQNWGKKMNIDVHPRKQTHVSNPTYLSTLLIKKLIRIMLFFYFIFLELFWSFGEVSFVGLERLTKK
jgi:hypothetical protein